MSALMPPNDDLPEAIPESGNGHLPGPPILRRQVRQHMTRSGFRSDARHPSEIVKRVGANGDTYDLPGRHDGQPRLLRVTIQESKEARIAVQQLAEHSIHVLEIWNDQNADSPGLWILVEYEAASGIVRTVFDRIERFTRDVIGGSPWDEIAQYTGLADRDITALKRYLSSHIRNAVQLKSVRMGAGTSRIGWTADLNGYARPGYTREGLRGLYATDAAYPWTAMGDLATQRRVLLDLFSDSPRALMVAGFATAGLLMRPLGVTENYLLGLVGPDSSSLGKSSLQLAIKSLFAAPDKLQTFDSTSKSLRATAIYGNDSVVLIDEIGAAGRTDPRERDALVYGLAAGVPRDYLVRVNGEFQPRGEQNAARYTAIVSGEESLIDRQNARKGIKIRYSDLAVTPDRRLWGFVDSPRMEQAMADLRAHHGHVFPALVDLLLEHPEQLTMLQAYFRDELSVIRERCGNEKQARKARIVALARTGLVALRLVLDPHQKHDVLIAEALDASDELLDEYVDAETASETANGIASLPVALAQHLAVATETGAKMPTRAMVGTMWPNEIRYRSARFGDVQSIANEPPGEAITGTVIVLEQKSASTIVREKLGVDLDMLVAEGIKHGLVKLRGRSDRAGYRKTSMSKFIVSEAGDTVTKSAIEIMVPKDWEPPETDTTPRADYDDADLNSRPYDPVDDDDSVPF